MDINRSSTDKVLKVKFQPDLPIQFPQEGRLWSEITQIFSSIIKAVEDTFPYNYSRCASALQYINISLGLEDAEYNLDDSAIDCLNKKEIPQDANNYLNEFIKYITKQKQNEEKEVDIPFIKSMVSTYFNLAMIHYKELGSFIKEHKSSDLEKMLSLNDDDEKEELLKAIKFYKSNSKKEQKLIIQEREEDFQSSLSKIKQEKFPSTEVSVTKHWLVEVGFISGRDAETFNYAQLNMYEWAHGEYNRLSQRNNKIVLDLYKIVPDIFRLAKEENWIDLLPEVPDSKITTLLNLEKKIRDPKASLLEYALREDSSLADKLYKKNLDISNYQLIDFYEIEPQNFSLLHKLIREGVIEPEDRENRTLLHYAAYTGNFQGIKLCMKANMNLNAVDKNDETPLMAAADQGNINELLELLDNGANPHKINSDENNALMLAAEQGHLSIVRELLKRGAEIDLKDVDGNTALHLAIEGGYLDVVRELVESGADIEIEDARSCNALVAAVMIGDEEITNLLINKLNEVRPVIRHQSISPYTNKSIFMPRKLQSLERRKSDSCAIVKEANIKDEELRKPYTPNIYRNSTEWKSRVVKEEVEKGLDI